MFEFFFKYSPAVFSKGRIVFLTPWPHWLLLLGILGAAGLLYWHVIRHRGYLKGLRPLVIWLLQTAMLALLLLLLWHPALSVATLRPQQNMVAVLIDDSRSMGTPESGKTRLAQAQKALKDNGLLDELSKKFQVRLYEFDKDIKRVNDVSAIAPTANATRIGDSLDSLMAESSSIPLGAVVVVSDGSDNTGGIDLDTISRIRQQRVPVNTIGVGKQKLSNDVEVLDVSLPPRALPDSRLSAVVTLRQFGHSRDKGRLSVRDGGKVLASQNITFKGDGLTQTESIMFNAGAAGPRALQFAIDPLPGEENTANDSLMRLINVNNRKARVLYMEGEPRWEYKFIRRALEDDKSVEVVSMVRTTQNKIYRQGISNPHELEAGFPTTAEELFAYDGLIIGSVDAGYFTNAQQDLIREFANRRGGGVLFLAGRFAMTEGGWARSSAAEMFPVRLISSPPTFFRDFSAPELTAAGKESVICRLEDNADRSAVRWSKMPGVANYQVVGEVKPGAVELLDVIHATDRKKSPLLVVENYGRGRTAVFATAGSWRWKMLFDHNDSTHSTFWSQLLRWLVSETPGQVTASTPRQVLSDETKVHFQVDARNKDYEPVSNAEVEAHILEPSGSSEIAKLAPVANQPGIYAVDWDAAAAGSYVSEFVVRNDKGEVGRDVMAFRREDGVAENFHLTQNRDLLEKLSSATGGHYYPLDNARKLANEISYSEAGITAHEMLDLWDMPFVFLLAILLRGGEWLLRRKWGVV
ncbi:MAG TPA: glutamine amidotransferase [Bryobacteraceae bacterium]|jgi:uncharacterized membrane protein